MQSCTKLAVKRAQMLSAITGRALALLRSQMAFRARATLRQSSCIRSACRQCSQAPTSPSVSQPVKFEGRMRSQKQQRSFRCSIEAHAGGGSATAEHADTDAQRETDTSSRPHMLLYNTMSRTKEVFTPRADQGSAVSMYVCGVTVYSMSHMGHARAYVAFDVLYRYLQQLGYSVHYVRNFTDVDDKIINRAAELGESPSVLSQRYIDEFHKDMRLLGCLPPALEPRATEYIPAMVSTISQIIDNGHAYVVGGDVFFDINSLPGYGRLSRHAQDDGQAGQRVEVDARKRSPADFALWKAAKPGEPEWDSPWGRGRPGWHIECSAMIRHLMGPVIDIHGGGRDLQFPHHENELAQSQAAACGCDAEHRPNGGADFVRYWVHNGFVNVDSEKMSKSLGNFFTIREATAAYAPAALRFWLLGTHYRAAVNYTQRALEEASERLFSFYQAVHDARQTLSDAGAGGVAAATEAAEQTERGQGAGGEVLAAVHAAMCDDLNTPQAIATLSEPVTRLNDLLFTRKGRKQVDRLQLLAALSDAVITTFRLLGLPDDPPAVLQELRAKALTRAGLTEEEVARRIDSRTEARKAKDYEEADAVRARLAEQGIMIMDGPTGTTWRPGIQETSS